MEKTCSVSECSEPVRTRQMCNRHYQQWWKNTPLTERTASRPAPKNTTCTGPECEKTAHAHGLCGGHLQQRSKGRELTVLRDTQRSDTRDEQGRKRCARCKEWMSVDRFYPNGKFRDGLDSTCRLCDRLFKYHITAREFHELLNRQGGVCAICGRIPPEFHVDHDHGCCPDRKKSCGNCVRGLLCPDCNGALGMMNDDPERMENAARYIREVMYVRASS